MVAYNFQPEFAELVEKGLKKQTIRATRRIKVGEDVQLYVGQRTKNCRKIGDATCVGVWRVVINEFCLKVSGKVIEAEEMQRFAKADGFGNYQHMREWFKRRYGLPFAGWLIQWE